MNSFREFIIGKNYYILSISNSKSRLEDHFMMEYNLDVAPRGNLTKFSIGNKVIIKCTINSKMSIENLINIVNTKLDFNLINKIEIMKDVQEWQVNDIRKTFPNKQLAIFT